MAAPAPTFNGKTPEEIFEEFRARRAGIGKALTTDVEKFLQECDTAKDSLCLYGLPDESWQMRAPSEKVPQNLPEPTLGINNLARNSMERNSWLKIVAVHSDAWLLSVAFYYAGLSEFDSSSRNKLFNMLNGLPTL